MQTVYGFQIGNSVFPIYHDGYLIPPILFRLSIYHKSTLSDPTVDEYLKLFGIERNRECKYEISEFDVGSKLKELKAALENDPILGENGHEISNKLSNEPIKFIQIDIIDIKDKH